MNSPTLQVVEQAIAADEAKEAGLIADDKEVQTNEDTKDTQTEEGKDAGTDKSEAGKDDKPADDKADDKQEEGEQYGVDDAVEVEEPDAAAQQQAPTDNAGIQLSPAEQKYIADNIGDPIVVRGVVGEGENAKAVEFKAYSIADIPADFRFTNDRDRLAVQTGFQSLETKANQLLGDYRQNASRQAQADFERRENEGIKADLKDLQDNGIEINGETYKFPKFRVRPGAKGFDETPEAQRMAEVLQIMSDTNATYLKQYEQGRPYKHIGFAEAYEKWLKQNPATKAEIKANEDQKQEDKARQKHAEQGQNNRGMEVSNIVKPTIRSGTSTRDLMARIDALD